MVTIWKVISLYINTIWKFFLDDSGQKKVVLSYSAGSSACTPPPPRGCPNTRRGFLKEGKRMDRRRF
ncbi:hypothetical protein L1987_78000 [Smallanthus sonchifolius]|uniref:Uncharacterized protein n=1 Tax=Smallanthus sonchifolius TaxID=185202 RepID=A0ACB8ZB55_9ASTR|nr:hypothetical protein L1987_78000 [Smallanthus sonchifolius]